MKIKKIFSFGEEVQGYQQKVLNEREIRAGAGILFLFALISFMNSWMNGNFYYTKVFVIAFLVDFTLRIFINPRYSPSLILGRIFVHKQTPEYVGALQKRFAWSIGFVLALLMFFLVVVSNVVGPINLFVCLTCLILLFSESVFGICIACKLYNTFHKKKAEICPGGVCVEKKKEDIQKIHTAQIVTLLLFLIGIIFMLKYQLPKERKIKKQTTKENTQDCVVPQWAIDIGHEELYKLHHGCE